jgi:hypothetical protein
MDDAIPDGKPRSSSTAKGPDSSHDDLSRLQFASVKGGTRL